MTRIDRAAEARAEAERRVATKRERMRDTEGEHLSHSWGTGFQAGFREAAEWAEAREGSTLPERFRDPSALARFIIENEWALDSEINPSGIADWHETLHRVYDAWDADTPEDIVSTVAAAIRLDRSFRSDVYHRAITRAELDEAATRFAEVGASGDWVSLEDMLVVALGALGIEVTDDAG